MAERSGEGRAEGEQRKITHTHIQLLVILLLLLVVEYEEYACFVFVFFVVKILLSNFRIQIFKQMTDCFLVVRPFLVINPEDCGIRFESQ